MNSLVRLLINPYTLAYLLILIGSQILYRQRQQHKRDRIATQRRTRGLPAHRLIGRTENLTQRRRTAFFETTLLGLTLIGLPLALIGLARLLAKAGHNTTADQTGLVIIALGLLGISLFGGMNAAKAFISGLAYKLTAAFTIPFQLGDHVTIQGVSGRVTQINTFFTKLQTLNGQQVSFPTHTLWKETITTYGRRAPLCEMIFYLSPHITSEQYTIAENLIRETVRSSAYVEPSKPIQIYCKQLPDTIVLTTTAHATATEHSAAFCSNVTRQFLAFAHQKQLPLAAARYHP